MSLYGWLAGRGPSGFGYSSTAEEVSAGLDLRGKYYLVTGCNSGIGRETARVLASRGATIVGAARSLEKARQACAGFAGEAIAVECELSEPESVRRCLESVKALGHPLDGIIANAGIMGLPQLVQKHGLELQFLTNHIGHFILVTGLLGQLGEAGRVVMLSSRAHRMAPPEGIQFDNLSGSRGYGAWSAYGQSKLANLLFARALSRRLPLPGQRANAVHPGVIVTKLGRHMNFWMRLGLSLLGPLFLKSQPEGAATQVWAAVHPDAGRLQGEYLADCNLARPKSIALDEALADRLWVESERIAASL